MSSLPPEEAPDEDDNYVTDKYSFADRVKYWYGGSIDDTHLIALQCAIIVEAAKPMVGGLKMKLEK